MSNSVDGRLLHVRTRSNGSPSFARLSEALVSELLEKTLEARQEQGVSDWRIVQQSEVTVDFLPLELRFPNGTSVYSSYNGGRIFEEGVVEIPRWMVPKGVSEQSHVKIIPLPSIRDVKDVELVPLSVGDWELLEINAEFLENGGLLEQVSVLYKDQVVVLKVHGGDMARVRVHANWDQPCRRLVAGGQVRIKPVLRRRNPQTSPPMRLLMTADDLSSGMRQFTKDEGITVPTVSPHTLLMSRSTFENCFKIQPNGANVYARVWKDGASKDVPSEDITTVAMLFSDAIESDHVAMNVLNRWQIKANALSDKIKLGLIAQSEVQRMRIGGINALGGERDVSFDPVRIEVEEGFKTSPWLMPDSNCFGWPSTLAQLGNRQRPFCSSTGDVCLSHGSFMTNPSADQAGLLQVIFDAQVGKKVQRSLLEDGRFSLPFLIADSSVVNPLVPHDSLGVPNERGIHTIVLPFRESCLNLLPPTPHFRFETQVEIRLLEYLDGVIIHGEIGSGRTHHALQLSARMRLFYAMSTIYLDCQKLQMDPDLRMNDILVLLLKSFEDARQLQKCVVVLENLDELVPSYSTGENEQGSMQQMQVNPAFLSQSKLLCDHLRRLMEATRFQDETELFFILTCKSKEALPTELLTSGLLLHFQEVPLLGSKEREELLERMIHTEAGSLVESNVLAGVGSLTEGFRARDLHILATRVCRKLSSESQGSVDKLKEAVVGMVNSISPLSRKGVQSEETDSEASWDDVGGLFEAKKKLTATILDRIRYRGIFEKAPVRLPRGVLLFGPPGCGKSFLVPALAKNCGFSLIMCRGPELLDKYIGTSEAKVRQLFARARAAAPALLFLDELDALAPRRGTDHTGVTDRVVNQLLTYLDGVETNQDKEIYIIAATSRPDKIDAALLRPGRLEQHVYVGFPSSEEERDSLFRKIRNGRAIEPQLQHLMETRSLLIDEPTVSKFAAADMRAIWNTAYLNAVREHLDAGETDENEQVTISVTNMISALETTKPSLGSNDRRQLQAIYDQFRGDGPSPSSGKQDKLRTALR